MGRTSQRLSPEEKASKAEKAEKAEKISSKKKSHYPSSQFDVSTVKRRTRGYGLCEVVRSIVRCEEEALRPIFDSSSSSSSKDAENKKALYASLLQVLHTLPTAIAQQLEDDQDETTFLPEISGEMRATVQQKQERLAALQSHSAKLGRYVDDFESFKSENNLWLGEAPPVKQSTTSSEQVETAAKRYMSILDSIDNSCDQILQLSDNCNRVMQTSRQQQEKLYDEYNALRLRAAPDSHSTALPKDNKDLLRGLMKI